MFTNLFQKGKNFAIEKQKTVICWNYLILIFDKFLWKKDNPFGSKLTAAKSEASKPFEVNEFKTSNAMLA